MFAVGLISKSDNGWELHTIADGSLSCENFWLSDNDIASVEKIILPEFGQRMEKEHVFISWDNWSGVFIMHLSHPVKHTADSDKLIKEIYDRLTR